MKKKIVSLTLAATMSLAVMAPFVAGCAGDSTDYEHTIVFYSSQGDTLQGITKRAIEKFEAKYPGWTVEHSPQGGYDDVKSKIMSDLEGEQQPDLAYCYPDHVAQYLTSELVLDMNKFIYSTETVTGVDISKDENGDPTETNGQEKEYTIGYSKEELADFTKNFWEEGYATNFAGYEEYYEATSMLTLPFVKSTELLYYNKDILIELGYKNDKGEAVPPETWDELWAMAPAIKKAYPTSTVLGYDSEANWFITMCEQNGWGYTSIDENEHYLFKDGNQDRIDWLNSLTDMYSKSKGWITTQETYQGYTSTLFTNGPAKGGIVFCIGSSGGASYQNPADKSFTAGVTQIPGTKQADGTINRSVISQGPSLVMFSAGNNVSNVDEKAKMTFLFIKELLDPEFQTSFSMSSGYNPCRESVYDLMEEQEANSVQLVNDAREVAKEARSNFFTSPAFVGSSEARTQAGNIIVYCMKGQRSAEVALNMAYSACGGTN